MSHLLHKCTVKPPQKPIKKNKKPDSRINSKKKNNGNDGNDGNDDQHVAVIRTYLPSTKLNLNQVFKVKNARTGKIIDLIVVKPTM